MMPGHGHRRHATQRPGGFGFPVATVVKSRGGTGSDKGWNLPLANLQAGALAMLIALHVLGPSLSGSVPTIAACAFILVFGLPHGALDLEIVKRERRTGRFAMVALLLCYLGLAGAMAAIWQLAPVIALAIFLIVAIVHFAEDWPELGSKFLAQGMAIALLSAPTLFHMAELRLLFVALSGHSDAALVADFLLLLAPTSLAVASVAVSTLWRTGSHAQAAAAALTIAGMVLLPPVIGFALFFCLYHSPRHLGAALARVAWARSARRVILPITLAALGIAVALFAGEARADLSAQVVAASFMTLSLLTVPHMLIPFVVDALAARPVGRIVRRGRTT